MALSDGDKLIVVMLADLHEAMGLKGSVDPAFVRNHVDADFWAIKDEYPGIFGFEERDSEDIKFVIDVLDMWRILEASYAHLGASDQKRVTETDGSHGREPSFSGFDGHTDAPTIADILINKQGKWAEFKGRPLDSHTPDRDVHERMLQAYLPLRGELHFGTLDADAIISVMNARIHPSNR